MRETEVRYAEHTGHYLAFSVFGEGPHDLAVQQWRCPIDLIWELPQLAAFMEALGGMARVIVYDGRGTGASDSFSADEASMEEVSDDLLAILDAAGSDRATVFDMAPGTGAVFAATHPERVRSLILANFRSSYPEMRRLSAAERMQLVMALRNPEILRDENPRVAHDPVLRRWWGRAARLGTTPERQAKNIAVAANTNFDHVLPTIRTPTLVFHRRENRMWPIEPSRAAASRIPGARFVELPGAENDLFLGDTGPVLAEIERFLAEPEPDVEHDRPLATVLFTDIVESTEHLIARGDDAWRHVLDDHDQTMDRVVTSYRGQVVKQLGDGILATFDGPARAVRCAAAILDAASTQGISLRAGVHTGEIELRPADVAGIAVHIASRIAALAKPSEILVSRTVVDLTAGSSLQFEPRGEHQLKGVPGTWPTYAALTDT
jgi:class 3 adenylate cyclase